MKSRSLYIPIYISIILLMGSCALGKKYKSPELNLPELITENHSGQDSLLLADLQWWEIYTDTTLQNLIRETLENNKDMAIAAWRVSELASLRRIDNAALLPQIGATLAADNEWENYGGEKPTSGPEYDAKLTASWEIDLWGNLRWARQRGISQYLEAVETKQAMQMSLIAQVARSYFELCALDNELAIVRQTLATREEGMRQAQIRFEGGLTSETSFQQAQVELAATATLVPELMRKVKSKENEISLLAGRYPGSVERIKLDSALMFPSKLPVGLPSQLLQRRPDVRAAEQSLKAAHAAVGMAYTDRFPRIRLTGAYGFENSELQTLLQSPYGMIVGNLTAPLFAFNAKRAKHRAQQAVYEQETANYEKKVLTVFREVHDAIEAYNSTTETRRLRSNLERASGKYEQLARLQYINGVINYLDVLDAQRRYFDAQIGLTNAVRDEYIALVNLYKALGGGWISADEFSERSSE